MGDRTLGDAIRQRRPNRSATDAFPARDLERDLLSGEERLLLESFAARFPTLASRQYRRWRDNGTLEAVHAALREQMRRKARRAPTPSAAILDSQSVRVAEKRGGCWGYDAGKRIPGRKRHLITDTLGLIWAVAVHAANVQDRDGAKPLLRSLDAEQFPRLDKVFADAGYQGKLEDWTAEELGVVLRIVPKLAGQSTFAVLPKRWIVERTFAWLMRYRRLRSEYETTVQSSVGWIYAAMIHRMVRSLTPASHHSAEKNAATSRAQSSGCSIAAK